MHSTIIRNGFRGWPSVRAYVVLFGDHQAIELVQAWDDSTDYASDNPYTLHASTFDARNLGRGQTDQDALDDYAALMLGSAIWDADRRDIKPLIAAT